MISVVVSENISHRSLSTVAIITFRSSLINWAVHISGCGFWGKKSQREKGSKNKMEYEKRGLAYPQMLLKQHVKNQQFFNS